ncbi:hypothetical protein [Bacillus cereus]|uniref:Uncharacterized protein n=1 Tax=Bacillus cereus VD196 TaxID=1053243 RepID=A0A9W5VBF0_BACCE|nr:hypothetical protein [Bacillus cereus]EJR58932.1 hypothetical protein IIO_04054 [Bacillus cereus VD115]EJR89748.1 hypothetical protein IKG_06091 [Bacillus cereus VD200]EOO70366.1 hypothetical protein IKE_00003 [Bacillus cereus VD196]
MLKFIKEKLPLIGAFCLLIITLVNYSVNNESVTGIVSISLFVFVLILYFISRNQKKD